MIPSYAYKLLFKDLLSLEKVPHGEHERIVNIPTINEVAIVAVRDQFQPTGVVLDRGNNLLTKVIESHRCYNVL